MTFFNLFLLAVIQGVTEFLPVSSSGHLILLPALTSLEDQGLVIDVAVHVGTLFAVIFYFRRDVALGLSGVPDLLRWKIDNQGAWLALCLVIATIPVVIVGFILKITGAMEAMRSIAVIGWMMIIFGIILYIADRNGKSHKVTENWSLRDALILGLWQAVSLIPGTSRSGITMTAALFVGMSREGASRFAFLLSIPVIFLAGALETRTLMALSADIDWLMLGAATVVSGISAYLCIHYFLAFIRRIGMQPFVVYRVVLGVILLSIFWRPFG